MGNLQTCKVCGDLHMCLNLIEGRCHKCTHKRLKELEKELEEIRATPDAPSEVETYVKDMIYMAASEGLPAGVRNASAERALEILQERYNMTPEEAAEAFAKIMEEQKR